MDRLRLLAIDDDPAFARRVAEVARDTGFTALAAADTREFVALYPQFGPDVIVTETVMSDLDGLQLISWLQDQACRARVLIVTGFNPHYAHLAEGLIDRNSAMSVDILYKPVDNETLARALGMTFMAQEHEISCHMVN